MTGGPAAFDDLAGIGREQLWGLIEQGAGPAWAATYENRWQRGHRTIEAVVRALRAARDGERATSVPSAAPVFLPTLVKDHVQLMSRVRLQSGAFDEVRLLERLGLVDLDHDDTYVLAVIGGLGGASPGGSRTTALREDPALLEQVWRFFEVEGGGEVSLAAVDKYSGGAGWRQVLVELVADGALDRQRVLRCCLQALGRDFSAFRAGWFSAFLESLDPAPDELAARQAALCRLLGSPVTATAAVAVRALKKVAAAGLLDDQECGELAPGLLGRTKGTALEVLRLLGGVARRRPDLVEVVARAAATALEHEHPDVQRAAVRLLDAIGAAGLATASADFLAPTVRRQATGQAHRDHGVPPGLVRIAPVALRVPRGGDLVEAVAALLEDAQAPMAVEAVMAGLAATGDRDLLAPLTRRAGTLMKRNGFAGGDSVEADLARLVLAAAGTPAAGRQGRPADRQGPVGLLRARLGQVEEILSGRARSGPLIATPTDVEGWIDPQVLVARLAVCPHPHPADLVGALLRLGQEGRPSALQAFAAQQRTDETGDVVRHALGGAPRSAGVAQVLTPALWVAASRARVPFDEDPFLLSVGLDAGGQGRPVRADLDVRFEPFSFSDHRGTHAGRHARFGVVHHHPPRAPAASPALEPTRVPLPGARRSDLHLSPTWARWAATIHPHDTEPIFSRLVLHVLEALGQWEVDRTVGQVLVALAHHPGRVGPLGAVTAAAGLAAQDPTHRVLATDAVVTLVGRASLTPGSLAEAMRTIAAATRLARWAPSLEQIAATIGGDYVVDVLTDLLPALPRDAGGLVRLLTVLAEEATRVGRPATDPVLRQYLESFTGRSGAAAAARRILAVA